MSLAAAIPEASRGFWQQLPWAGGAHPSGRTRSSRPQRARGLWRSL